MIRTRALFASCLAILSCALSFPAYAQVTPQREDHPRKEKERDEIYEEEKSVRFRKQE